MHAANPVGAFIVTPSETSDGMFNKLTLNSTVAICLNSLVISG